MCRCRARLNWCGNGRLPQPVGAAAQNVTTTFNIERWVPRTSNTRVAVGVAHLVHHAHVLPRGKLPAYGERRGYRCWSKTTSKSEYLTAQYSETDTCEDYAMETTS